MKNPQINKDLLDSLIRDSGVPFKENSISFIFDCPRCGKSKKLYIRKKDGKFICFRCADEGFRGRCEYALVELLSISLDDAKQSLYGDLKVDFTGKKLFLDLTLPDDDFGQPEEELQTVSYPSHFIGFEQKELTGNAFKYLCEKRNLKPERLAEYKLKFNPSWNTVVFPVEYQGSLYGWQERSIFNDFRYTLKGFKKESILMFQDRLDSSEHAILTEGPMDALKAHLCGGNVCAMGKLVSDTQLKILKEKVKRVYVALDPDAWKEIDNICRKLHGELEVYILQPPTDKKDLGECTEEEVFEQFKQAKKYSGQLLIKI